MIRGPVRAARLIGRIPDLRALTERHDAARGGAGSIVLLAGTAGTGKSRLISELRKNASARGDFNAVGSCYAFAQTPYAPITDLVQAMLRAFPGAAPPSGHLRKALTAIAPDLEVGFSSEAHPGEMAQKRWVFDAFFETLGRFSAKSPGLLVLEDLQWADAGTLDALRSIAPRIADLRICVVASYRDDEVRRHPYLQGALADIERSETHHVALRPLDEEESLALTDDALGGRPGVAVDARYRVSQLAEGNPLFIEELVRHIVETEQKASLEGLPRSIELSVQSRLSEVSTTTKKLLEVAAVIGREFTTESLTSLLEARDEDVNRGLFEAREHGFISEKPGDITQFSFRHELTRSAVYESSDPFERRRLHGLLAHALEGSPEEERRLADLAFHWRRAGNKYKAALLGERAGDAASALHAHEDAALQYTRALASGGASEVDTIRLQRKAAEMYFLTAAPERGLTYFESIIEYYAARSENGKLAEAYLDASKYYARTANLPRAMELTEMAVRALPGAVDAAALKFAAEARLAEFWALREDMSSARRHIALADPTGIEKPTHDVVRYHQTKAVLAYFDGDIENWRKEAEAAARHARALGDPEVQLASELNLGMITAEVGELVSAETVLRGAVNMGRTRAGPGLTAYAELALADVLFERGNVSEARDAAVGVLRRGIDTAFIRIALTSVLIPIALATKDSELIDRCYDAELLSLAWASGEGARFGPLGAALAELALARGDRNTARSLLQRVVPALKDCWSNLPGLLLVAAAGFDDEIPEAGCLLTATVGKRDDPRLGGYAELFKAYVAHNRGDPEGAQEYAASAARLFRRIGAKRRTADAWRVMGDFSAAREAYLEMGMMAEVDRIDALSTRNGEAARLSPRESEIAVLVATGKSDREIASLLNLSKRTVEHHVASALRKTGSRTRTELAVNLTRSAAEPNAATFTVL